MGAYSRFAVMIATATVIMLALMYLNTYALDHVLWSQTRFYMAILMGASMAFTMLGFMWGMYKDKRTNVAILAGSAAVFALSLYLVRSQATIGDSWWMSAMIPHHSIAILTSERADIDDVRAQDLAGRITETQRREIAEMKWLLDDIKENGPATTPEAAARRPVPDFSDTAAD